MSNAKHTPGPWKVCGGGRCVLLESCTSKSSRTSGYGYDSNFICDLDDGEYHEYADKEEMLANAALIAAAPEMYEALSAVAGELERTCEQCTEMGENHFCTDTIQPCPAGRVRELVSKALRKARGEE